MGFSYFFKKGFNIFSNWIYEFKNGLDIFTQKFTTNAKTAYNFVNYFHFRICCS